jgi:hypothetical protein
MMTKGLITYIGKFPKKIKRSPKKRQNGGGTTLPPTTGNVTIFPEHDGK